MELKVSYFWRKSEVLKWFGGAAVGIMIMLSMMMVSVMAWGQNVGISDNVMTPDPSAGLEVRFTNKGLLIPRLTTAQRDAIVSPAHSLLIFNTTTNCFEW